jgi:hypothetical protein
MNRSSSEFNFDSRYNINQLGGGLTPKFFSQWLDQKKMPCPINKSNITTCNYPFYCVCLGMTVLSHRKLACAGTCHDNFYVREIIRDFLSNVIYLFYIFANFC